MSRDGAITSVIDTTKLQSGKWYVVACRRGREKNRPPGVWRCRKGKYYGHFIPDVYYWWAYRIKVVTLLTDDELIVIPAEDVLSIKCENGFPYND